MSEWISEFKQIGLAFFGRESSGEMWAMVVICVVVGFLLYKKLSAGFEGRGEKTFLTLIPGILLMAASAVAVDIYLNGNELLQWIAVLACFLLIVLPLTMLVEKARYFSAMVPWIVTAIVLAVILYVEPLVMNAVNCGIEKGSLMKDHRDEANELFK